MATHYNWKIKHEYFELIDKEAKTLEVRVGYSDIRKVQKGDIITFKAYSNAKFEVVRVTRYDDFIDMLDTEDPSKLMPGVSKYKALDIYREIYPEEKEALGVYVFELKKQKNNVRMYKLSSFINNHMLFGKIAQSAYCVTDHICREYPKHFNWYWTKQIPRVLNGTGEVIICTIDNNIAGVTFLKKDDTEAKICTLLVVDKYRGKHVATKLLNKAFKYLDTTKPCITIADYKIPMFSGIIQKYGWKLTQTTKRGYYNNISSECVYNGFLPE